MDGQGIVRVTLYSKVEVRHDVALLDITRQRGAGADCFAQILH